MELKLQIEYQQGQYHKNHQKEFLKQSNLLKTGLRSISFNKQGLGIQAFANHKNITTKLNLLEQNGEDRDNQLLSKMTMIENKVNDIVNKMMIIQVRTKYQLISELEKMNNANSVSLRILIAEILSFTILQSLYILP